MGVINLGRQTTKYNPKDHKFKEGVKDFVYTLESAAVKAKNSTAALTNTIKSGVKEFAADPLGSAKRDFTNMLTFSPPDKQGDYERRRTQFEAGQITQQEFSQSQKVYDLYKENQEKNALFKANLLRNDAEYQQYVTNRNISMFSPKRVAMAVTREAVADLANPYQLAVDLLGGKLGSLAATKLSKYGRWVGIGAEVSISAGTAGTANVVESYSYGKRNPKDLAIDFMVGSAMGFAITSGTRGFGALKNKVLQKTSQKIDNAVDNAIANNMSVDEQATRIRKQANDMADFYGETQAGKPHYNEGVKRFEDLRQQQAIANQVQYGALTENILEGRFPADDDIAKVLTYEYQPHDAYGSAKKIVQNNPDAISRWNQWLNETPDSIKMLSDLPDAEIRKIAPGVDGKTIREVQALKRSILDDFDNIDAQFSSAGIEDYSFSNFIDDEFNFTTSDRVINFDKLAELKTMKQTKTVDQVHNSNVIARNPEDIIPDADGFDFDTLNPDMASDVINKRMGERVNNINETVAAQQAAEKAANPDIMTADDFSAWNKKIENATPEDMKMLQEYMKVCRR